MTRLTGALLLLVLVPGRGQAGAPPQVRVRLLEKARPRVVEVAAPGKLPLRARAAGGQVVRGDRMRFDCAGERGVCLQRGSRSTCSTSWLVTSAAGKLQLGAGRLRRTYPGRLEIDQQAGRCLLVNQLSADDYAVAVACAELGRAPYQALAAQAVVARSFALAVGARHQDSRYDFCDLTHCQHYRGWEGCPAGLRRRLEEVAGRVVTMSGRPVETPYSSTCGGHTASAGDIWPGRREYAHLVGRVDTRGGRSNCSRSPHYRWRLEIAADKLCGLLRKRWPALGKGPAAATCRLSVLSRSPGGWVKLVALEGERRLLVTGEQLHLWLARRLGWSAFKSANFEIDDAGRNFVFRGKGLGHGVGLCQHGAMELARQGLDWRAILQFYYPGTEVGKLW